MEQGTLVRLIENSLNNDEKAFRQLVEAYQSLVYSAAFRLLCNEEDTRDAVQETFIKVWANLGHFDKNRPFSTWVYTIATRICYDRLQARKNKVLPLTPEMALNLASSASAEKALTNQELGNLIAALTDNLTPKQKLVFTLSELEALETKEISQVTGLSAGQIKSNLYLAKKYLREKLKHY